MILIGCEESQVICRAAREKGIKAISCDLLPTRGNPDWHIQGDIMDVIPTRHWDVIILHPDCTYMAVCNNRQAAKGKINHALRLRDIEWTIALYQLAVKHSDKGALENPMSVIFPYLRKLGARVQFVQPWQFGHGETKNTGFARWGDLPELSPTDIVDGREQRIFYMSPSDTRRRDRSVTYSGIAAAIVNQWF